MTTSKTLNFLCLSAFAIVLVSCNGKKDTLNDKESSSNDTAVIVTDKSTPDQTDTITPVTPTNETTKKVETPTEQPAVKSDLSGKGIIVQKGDIWVIRTTGTGGTDYVPSNLDDKFKVDGKEVTFEANLLPIPKGVRMAGNPITLVSIK